LGPSGVGEKAERLDRRPEQGDNRRADRGRHVHDSGVSGNYGGGSLEQRGGTLESKSPGSVQHLAGRPLGDRRAHGNILSASNQDYLESVTN
jgi:hypothetical protein